MEGLWEIRDTFQCGVIVLQDLLSFGFRRGVAHLASGLDAVPSEGSHPCPPDSQSVPRAAPTPSLAGSYALLSPCLVPSSVLLLVVDLWIFPPSFLVSRSSGWEGRVLQKQFWSLPRLLLLPL